MFNNVKVHSTEHTHKCLMLGTLMFVCNTCLLVADINFFSIYKHEILKLSDFLPAVIILEVQGL